MASSPLQFITDRASHFSAVSNLTELIALAEDRVGNCYCTDEIRNDVVGLLVCHWLALQNRQGSTETGDIGVGGDVKSEKEGDLARSYGSLQSGNFVNDDPYFMSTVYGIEILHLQSQCFILPRTRFTNEC